MDDKIKKVLDLVKVLAEEISMEISTVDKRDYSVICYCYEMECEDIQDFISENLSDKENLEFKATISPSNSQVDLRFDSENECTHILVPIYDNQLIDLLKELGYTE